ncbi:MAG: helix-turn-helix domain-containing protein [Alkalimonas sp.]|nr:helix-turn-helix domain-containing protein [Alkalimonas sp.]
MSRKATDWAWRYPASSSTVKLVLLALADRADEQSTCFPSIERLKRDTGLNRKTIIKATAELCNAGALSDTGQRKGATQRVKVYRLNTELVTVPKTELFQKRNDSKNGTLNSPKNGTLNSPKNGTQNQSVEPVIEPLLDHCASDRVKNGSEKVNTEQLFGQFWKHYSTKTGKQAAFKAWQKLMKGKRAGQVIFWNNLMLEYYHQQREAGTLGYEAIHASTFINQKRWEDDPEFMTQFKQEYLAENTTGAKDGTND